MNTQALDKVSLSVRALSMDAIEKAKSGHPGLPMGAAELAAILYGELLKHDPADPDWVDRDRFVLSAGHGSMWLYSILHLSGYDISLDSIKQFRQVGSVCAGHPEYGLVPGVETTTGPLGQGLATAVGMAIAETMLSERFNSTEHTIVDHYTYVLAGDGCLQEGVSSETSSLAGHLGLGKLICFYDSNSITIDGRTDLSFTEDVAKRYEAYGWQVLNGSMYDYQQITELVAKAKAEKNKPSLVILTSIIGKGAPNKKDSAGIHGSPLGADEIKAAHEALGLTEDFYIAPEAVDYFSAKRVEWKKDREAWKARFEAWSKANPEKRKEWDMFYSGKALPAEMPTFSVGDKLATRTASNKALIAVSAVNSNLVGGSADLKGPNAVSIPDAGVYSTQDRGGRYIHYGIREFGMAAISNGIQLHGGLRSFCATFMVFSDYLRPALRLSALMKQPLIYVLTHDSIFIGEDGPTHQPIEHLASLRAMPNLLVLRPGDAEETAEAWALAMDHTTGPIALVLSRQNIEVYAKADPDWRNTIRTGAYIARKCESTPDCVVIATGSEVSLALAAADKVKDKKVQVVSMLSKELFEAQSETIQKAMIPEGVRVITCEAASSMGWDRWAKRQDIMSVDRFGESGPGAKVAEYLGFTADALAALISK